MVSITLKNIPDELHQRLRESAQSHRRSVTAEILSLLEAQLKPTCRSPEGMLASIRGIQERHPIQPVTQEDIDRFKREGRL
jgi:plasmid stability protein